MKTILLEFEIFLFVVANIISFTLFALSVHRFRNHKIRYPLTDSTHDKALKLLAHSVVIGIWFLILVSLSVYFAYLIFFS